MQELTGLTLTQVALATRLLPAPGKQRTLIFLYGTPPGDPAATAESMWVEVDEIPHRFSHLRGRRITKAVEGSGPAATVVSWHLTENVPHRKLGLQIVSNESETIVRELGRKLVAASHNIV